MAIYATDNGHAIYDTRDGGSCKGIKPGDILVKSDYTYRVYQRPHRHLLDLWTVGPTCEYLADLDYRLALQAEVDETTGDLIAATRGI